jgi:hypothetical protein
VLVVKKQHFVKLLLQMREWGCGHFFFGHNPFQKFASSDFLFSREHVLPVKTHYLRSFYAKENYRSGYRRSNLSASIC